MSEHQIASPFIDVSRGERLDVEFLKSLMEDPSLGNMKTANVQTMRLAEGLGECLSDGLF